MTNLPDQERTEFDTGVLLPQRMLVEQYRADLERLGFRVLKSVSDLLTKVELHAQGGKR